MCMSLASSRVRKSSCVKEVERIQQRRIERRAAQQLMREQHEQDYDTNVPTWEFSAMIRYSNGLVRSSAKWQAYDNNLLPAAPVFSSSLHVLIIFARDVT